MASKKVTLDNISEQLEAIQWTLKHLDVDCSCLSENELENMLQRLFVNKVTPPTVPVLFSTKDNQEEWISPPFYTHPRGYKMELVISHIRPEPYGDANSPYDRDPSGWYANFSLLQGEYDDYLRFPIRMSIVLHVMKKATNESRSITVHFNDKTLPKYTVRQLEYDNYSDPDGDVLLFKCDELDLYSIEGNLTFHITRVDTNTIIQ